MNAKIATQTAQASNVVPFRPGVQMAEGVHLKDFEAHFKGKGSPTDRLLSYLGHQADVSRKEKASIINMIGVPEMREAVERWPLNREDIQKDILDNSVFGKAILAEIEAIPPKPRGDNAKKLARLRSRRNYVLSNMVKAKQLVGKLAEGENAGWSFLIENDTPEILVLHTSRPQDINSTTAGVIINAKTFVGKTKWDDVTTKAAEPPKPAEYKTTADALPVFKGLSAAFGRWVTGDTPPKLSTEFRAELAQTLQFGMELLGVPLTQSQKTKLEEMSETSSDEDDDTKAPDKAEDKAKQLAFAEADKRKQERANNTVDK